VVSADASVTIARLPGCTVKVQVAPFVFASHCEGAWMTTRLALPISTLSPNVRSNACVPGHAGVERVLDDQPRTADLPHGLENERARVVAARDGASILSRRSQ
jgi:hypothetical protein